MAKKNILMGVFIGAQSSTPRIVIQDPITIPAGQEYLINEQIMLDTTIIYDASCETDIIDQVTGTKIVNFRSLYNDGWGNMQFVWGPSNYIDMPTTGTYTLSQYCYGGTTIDQNPIYSTTTIVVT